jgi:hypothetical protein
MKNPFWGLAAPDGHPARPVTMVVLAAKAAMMWRFSHGRGAAGFPLQVVPHQCGCPMPSREGGRGARLAGDGSTREENGGRGGAFTHEGKATGGAQI